MNLQHIPQIKHTESGNFFLLAGPCAIEGEEMALRIAEKLVGITDKLQIPYVFKGSFGTMEGIAINNKTTAGNIVQTISNKLEWVNICLLEAGFIVS